MDINISKQFYISTGFTLILLTNLFIFIPFDIYVANAEEFITSFGEILKIIIIPAIFCLAFSSVIALLLNDKLLRLYITMLAILSILIWLQSDIVLWQYGLLNGEIIDWSEKKWRGWVDMGIWVFAIAIAVRYHLKIRINTLQFVFAIFLIQSVMTVYGAKTNWEKLRSKHINEAGALQKIHEFSSQKNIVHLLLDGYQSDIFEVLINHKEAGDPIRSALDGFVFYKETLAAFPYTRFSLPALLSGKIYKNDVSKDDFVNAVFSGKTILKIAYDKGYELDIASEEYWAQRYALGKHHNSYVIPKIGLGSADDFKWENSSRLLDLTLFKAAPHFIKRFIYDSQNWFVQSLIGDPLSAFFYFSHTRFMQGAVQNMSVGREAPVYKLIHIMNVHNPMVLDVDCSFAGEAIPTTRASLTVQSFCTTMTVIDYLEKMKSLGIYDDALIVIHADHGNWLKSKGFKEQILSNGMVLHPAMMALATPLLAIKQSNAKGKLRESSVLASLIDLPDTISNIMDWGEDFGHESILSLVPGESRRRSYFYYNWQDKEAWETDHTGPIYEFIFDQSHFDADWKLGRTFYPPEMDTRITK